MIVLTAASAYTVLLPQRGQHPLLGLGFRRCPFCRDTGTGVDLRQNPWLDRSPLRRQCKGRGQAEECLIYQVGVCLYETFKAIERCLFENKRAWIWPVTAGIIPTQDNGVSALAQLKVGSLWCVAGISIGTEHSINETLDGIKGGVLLDVGQVFLGMTKTEAVMALLQIIPFIVPTLDNDSMILSLPG